MSPRTVEPPPLRRMIIPALFVGALFAVTFLRQPAGPDGAEQWVLTGPTMGTVFTIKAVVPPSTVVDRGEVESAIRRSVDAVDSSMSTYRPDSELSRFNRHGTEPFEVSPALLDVVIEAQRVAELSGGAFDITVGPLVDAWGFGPEPAAAPPAAEVIESLLATHGFEQLEIDVEAGTLRKRIPELSCDLSAIAKGYAVDRVIEALAALDLRDVMVEIGGEVRASGHNAAGEVWRIGVERPVAGRRGLWTAIRLADVAMATSGDYRNYYERSGVRISHTIDPRTGRPVDHDLASVSVIHPSCMSADALATAISVLGPDQGRALVEREGLAALFLVRAGDERFEEWASERWSAIVENTPDAPDVTRTEDE